MPSHEPHGTGAGNPRKLNKEQQPTGDNKEEFQSKAKKSGKKDVIIPGLAGLIDRKRSITAPFLAMTAFEASFRLFIWLNENVR